MYSQNTQWIRLFANTYVCKEISILPSFIEANAVILRAMQQSCNFNIQMYLFFLHLIKDQPRKKKEAIPDFLPKSHTSSNTLHLPTESDTLLLPSDENLLNIYNYAFKNTYFGIV